MHDSFQKRDKEFNQMSSKNWGDFTAQLILEGEKQEQLRKMYPLPTHNFTSDELYPSGTPQYKLFHDPLMPSMGGSSPSEQASNSIDYNFSNDYPATILKHGNFCENRS